MNKILTEKELEALKNFLAEPYGLSNPNWEAARDALLATSFIKTAEKAVKAVDESAYPWIAQWGELHVVDGLLRLEVRFESIVKGTTGPDGCEVDLVEAYAAKKAAVKALKLSEAFERALEGAGFDVQRTGDPLDGVGSYFVSGTTDDDGNVVYGDWVAWSDEEPVLVFYVDCLPGAEGEES